MTIEESEQKIGNERLIPPLVREKLDEVREADVAYHEKAQQFAVALKDADCRKVEVLDCDVCVSDFDPGFYQRVAAADLEGLSGEELEAKARSLAETLPKEAFVRVHAETEAGRLTFCFNCDATMCMNEIDYPENPNWDDRHKEIARTILEEHPEWEVRKFTLWGSTRNRVCIDVITDEPELRSHQFDLGELHVMISPIRDTIQALPGVEDHFDSL